MTHGWLSILVLHFLLKVLTSLFFALHFITIPIKITMKRDGKKEFLFISKSWADSNNPHFRQSKHTLKLLSIFLFCLECNFSSLFFWFSMRNYFVREITRSLKRRIPIYRLFCYLFSLQLYGNLQNTNITHKKGKQIVQVSSKHCFESKTATVMFTRGNLIWNLNSTQ